MREFNYTMRIALAKGLRTTDRNKRNRQALVQSDGAYPDENALGSLELLTPIDITDISPAPSFPYPQIFELLLITIVCTEDAIYERADNGTLTLVLGGLEVGHPWTVADFGAFLCLVNGKQVVYRMASSKEWTTVDEYGIISASSVCDLNGQLIVSAPNTQIE